MADWQLTALQSNLRTLIRDIPTRIVLDFLKYDGIITDASMQLILSIPHSFRNHALLAMLFSMGPDAFACFLLALNQAGRKDLSALLTISGDLKEMKL